MGLLFPLQLLHLLPELGLRPNPTGGREGREEPPPTPPRSPWPRERKWGRKGDFCWEKIRKWTKADKNLAFFFSPISRRAFYRDSGGSQGSASATTAVAAPKPKYAIYGIRIGSKGIDETTEKEASSFREEFLWYSDSRSAVGFFWFQLLGRRDPLASQRGGCKWVGQMSDPHLIRFLDKTLILNFDLN